ncbi:MAG: phosphoribosylanthranilate isomerase [Verrucomicrobia bacterium]|nr:phosphoribosylanthranilate isomerase [Verrucomicrobiota bacterium]MCH8527212.1 phosphoribosylanthranilate isomerase [Kiritimatiellia bacterium]
MNGFIKLCGFTREVDVNHAVHAGTDALGFIFWPKSPRCVTAEHVAGFKVPTDRLKVGVFVNQPPEFIREAFQTANLNIVQLHGDEDADYIRALNLPVWKALHLDRLPPDWETLPVEALLIDSGTVEMPGGTGMAVDVDRAAAFVAKTRHKVLLAGGLKAGTVAGAVHAVQPFGVDVSSGIETAPGIKSPEAVSDFVRQARKAFHLLSTSSESLS